MKNSKRYKKKSLKRAIKLISLTFSNDTEEPQNSENEKQSDLLNQITIQIRDRNDQLTSINSIQSKVFDLKNTAETPHQQCLNSNITALACDQLYRSESSE